MANLSGLLRAASSLVRTVLRGSSTPPAGRAAPPSPAGRPTAAPPSPAGRPAGEPAAKGQSGPDATVELDPRSVTSVRMSYSPNTDGDPDPGEVVWTWVPFEERDGRGKDRPVLVVAAEPTGTVLVVQLTSKDHSGESDFVPLGAGAWDGEHRPSWVNLDRVFRVHPRGMRREATALDAGRFARVEAALRQRYGWR